MLFKQPGQLLGGHWPAEIVPLRFVTLMSLQKVELCLCLHALSNNPQIQASGPC
jgi:hypothetical protein